MNANLLAPDMHRPVRRRCLRLPLVLLALLAGSLCATPALAQDDDRQDEETVGGLEALPRSDQRAFEKLANACIEAYDRGRFEKAESLCLDAAAITPHPSTVFVRARIRDRTGRCDQAVELYRSVLDDPPAGPAEAKFVKDYREDATGYLDALGDCSAELEILCQNGDGVVIVTESGVSSGCGSTMQGLVGDQAITAVGPGLGPSTLSATGEAGRTVEVDFGRLDARDVPAEQAVRVECPPGPPGAVYVGDVLAGVCDDVVAVPSTDVVIEARRVDGSAAVAFLPGDAPRGSDTTVTLATVRNVAFECGDPELLVVLDDPLLTVNQTCADLSAAGGVEIPDGTWTFVLTKGESRIEQTFEISASTPQPVRLDSLDDHPVDIEVACADESAPQTYVKIGDTIGACPFSATVPPGSYAVEARREGHYPWESTWEVTHDSPPLVVPTLEETTVWTPGAITLIASGALLVTAVAIDVAGVSDLDRLKNREFDSCGGDTSPQECRDEIAGTVETNVWLTRVFYGLGAVAAATGAGLLIWELTSGAPGDFGETTVDADATPVSFGVAPVLAPDTGGISLRIVF